ncbi:helix-turn-helix domain-containing protein [Paenibacillus sp. MMS18-CY102]|uniref:helix-turn-helix domain-containing protein n=1 Tax=Paenibacillus sp. MMS18-CY102 TaxID=2682849 RepID=UPI00301483D3
MLNILNRKCDPLDLIIGTDDAAKLWNISQDHVKRLCREGRCTAKQIGKTWIILKDQANPTKHNKDV